MSKTQRKLILLIQMRVYQSPHVTDGSNKSESDSNTKVQLKSSIMNNIFYARIQEGESEY